MEQPLELFCVVSPMVFVFPGGIIISNKNYKHRIPRVMHVHIRSEKDYFEIPRDRVQFVKTYQKGYLTGDRFVCFLD